jgi:hypothetical protein
MGSNSNRAHPFHTTYDHMGRPTTGKSSSETRGTDITDQQQQKTQLPYRQSYKFNGFGNLIERNNLHWGVENWGNQANNLSYTYENNKITNSGWQYDADGRATQAVESNSYTHSTFDAKGQMTNMITDGTRETNRFYDGNGREVKRTVSNYVEDPNATTPPYGEWEDEPVKYFIRSSVLDNEVVSETDALGRKVKTYVRAAGATLAWQTVYFNAGNTETEYVNFEHWDASGLSYRSTTNDGTEITGEGAEGSPAELDPLGNNVGLFTPYLELIHPPPPEPEYPTLQPMNTDMPMYVNGQRVTATVDGIEVPYGLAMSMLANRSAIPAALAPYQHLPGYRYEDRGLGIFTATVPVQVGWHVNPNQSVTPVYSQHSTRSYTFAIPVSWFAPRQTQQKDENQGAVDQAVRDALNILGQNNDCSKVFGLETYDSDGNLVDERTDVTEIVKALGKQLKPGRLDDKNVGIRMQNNGTPGATVSNQITGLEYRLFNEAIVNTNGPFFTNGRRIGNYSSTSRAGRALAVLHEVAHLRKVGHYTNKDGRRINTYLIPPDDEEEESSETSQKNTAAIEKACKKELDALNNAQ